MASWMTHLRIAGELLERIPNLDAAQFGIGNIAPDAGVPDENWKHFDPPPNVTHYSSGKNHRGRYIRDLDYYRQFDDALAPGSPDARQRAFLLGYFFHLLTDRLFDAYIWSLPGPDIRSLSEVDRKQLIKTIREEWQSIDQIYVRDHPEAFFWTVFVDALYAGDYLPFLPAAAIQTRVELLQDIYQRKDARAQALYALKLEYFSSHLISDFVQQTSQELYTIYDHIWNQRVDLGQQDSALFLLEA